MVYWLENSILNAGPGLDSDLGFLEYTIGTTITTASQVFDGRGCVNWNQIQFPVQLLLFFPLAPSEGQLLAHSSQNPVSGTQKWTKFP